jgi:hypothetical protein
MRFQTVGVMSAPANSVVDWKQREREGGGEEGEKRWRGGRFFATDTCSSSPIFFFSLPFEIAPSLSLVCDCVWRVCERSCVCIRSKFRVWGLRENEREREERRGFWDTTCPTLLDLTASRSLFLSLSLSLTLVIFSVCTFVFHCLSPPLQF